MALVSNIRVQLAREGETLSGTEQYERIGETLWLQGSADSLDNFSIEERSPKDRVTGVFKGKFSQGCKVVSGYFSKPDGSWLQPFELREVGPADPVGRSGGAPRRCRAPAGCRGQGHHR